MISEIFLQADPFDISNVVEFTIIGFSLVLFGLSLSAYRNSGMKRILFAAVAFALFSVQLFLDYVEELFSIFEEDTIDIVLSIVTLGILMMFFLAIVKRK